ncbi:uncharacterized protein LOC144451348 [Glandiceps talaboti]
MIALMLLLSLVVKGGHNEVIGELTTDVTFDGTEGPTTAEQHFILEPSNATVQLGESVTFHCAVEDKTGLVKWVKVDDVDILSADDVIDDDNDATRLTIESTRPGVDFNLKITNVTVEDAGTYSCVLSMGMGDSLEFEFSRNAFLEVLVPTTKPPILTTTLPPCVTTTSQHSCSEEPLSEDYKISLFDVSFRNIEWTDDLLVSSSCIFNNEAVKVIDILFDSFDASQLQGKIQCLTITSFTRGVLIDGEYAIKINAEIPVPINAGISKADLDNAFTCGLLRTNASSIPEQYAHLEDTYCNYEDPATSTLPVVTVIQTPRTTTPPPFYVRCVTLTEHRMCSRESVKQTVINLILTIGGVEWKSELNDRTSCYFQNVGANITNALFPVFNVQPIQEERRCFYIKRYQLMTSARSVRSVNEIVQASIEFGISQDVGMNLTESYMHELISSQLLNSTHLFREYGLDIAILDINVDKEEAPEPPTQAPKKKKNNTTMMIVYLVLGGVALIAIGIATARLVIHRMTRIPPEVQHKLREKRKNRNDAQIERNAGKDNPQRQNEEKAGKYKVPDDPENPEQPSRNVDGKGKKRPPPTDTAQNGFRVHPRPRGMLALKSSQEPPWHQDGHHVSRDANYDDHEDIGNLDGFIMDYDGPVLNYERHLSNYDNPYPAQINGPPSRRGNDIPMAPWSQYSSRTDTHY